MDLAELADGSTVSGEVAKGRCLFARNLSATRSTVLTEKQFVAVPSNAPKFYLSVTTCFSLKRPSSGQLYKNF